MNIQSLNAEQKLVSLASSIGRDPLSWVGWSCVYLDLTEMTGRITSEDFLWVGSVVESYFGDVECHMYICHGEEIHIICKTMALDILHQAAKQICDLSYNENDRQIYYRIYNLTRDADTYLQTALNRASAPHAAHRPVMHDALDMLNTFDEGVDTGSLTDKVKVLLVEDDPITRWMVRNALKRECEFVTAPTANKAFAMYSAYNPDIVFLDIGLPDKSGREVLEWIMRNDPGACVVMFSGNDNLDNIAGTLEDGATGFIKKPFLKESLMHYIHNHVG